MLDQADIFNSDSEILNGQLVFLGTRVPVRILFEYLEGGESIEVFLQDFPSVTREQTVSALEVAFQGLSYARAA